MVSRRGTQPCVEHLALPLSAAGVSYEQLLEENRRRGRLDPEYELLDTGVFDDDRYWVVDVTYAKAEPTDVLMTIDVTNAGPDTEVLHVLPTLWFRNTWSWDDRGDRRRELAAASDSTVGLEHPFLGPLEMVCGTDPLGADTRAAVL